MSKKYVVDASVGFKWFLPEEYEQQAEKLLEGAEELIVPDLFYTEIANVCWKRVQRGDFDQVVAESILAAVSDFRLGVTSGQDLSGAALDISFRVGCSVYDATYLALAVREEAVLVTADKKFVNSLEKTPLAKYCTFISSL